jgi:putative transposase
MTQRGNGRRVIFESQADRLVYLDLLGQHGAIDHVALIAIPKRDDSLWLALKHTHGRYATYFNALHASTGHVWQGRYDSCPLDERHFWAALRYTELTPVRAGMVADAEDYEWSSAAGHCGFGPASALLDTDVWRERWTAATWREYRSDPKAEGDVAAIRRYTHTGRPLGSEAFVTELEEGLWRRLAPGEEVR